VTPLVTPRFSNSGMEKRIAAAARRALESPLAAKSELAYLGYVKVVISACTER
jgi:hypothetical protein